MFFRTRFDRPNLKISTQKNIRSEYKRSCEDEIDWNTVEQLHESTLKISSMCFEYKKLCVGLISVAVGAMFKLEIQDFLFVVIMVITFGFWFCDATAYFYQKKNRDLMQDLLDKIVIRNGIEVKKKKRFGDKPLFSRLLITAVNYSMSIYIIISLVAFTYCFAWRFLRSVWDEYLVSM